MSRKEIATSPVVSSGTSIEDSSSVIGTSLGSSLAAGTSLGKMNPGTCLVGSSLGGTTLGSGVVAGGGKKKKKKTASQKQETLSFIERDEEIEGKGVSKGKKKKKPVPSSSAAKKEPARKGISASAAAKIKAKREEEERKRREDEERKKKEKKERLRKEREEKLRVQKLKDKKVAKKLRRKQNKQRNAQVQNEQEREAAMARLGVTKESPEMKISLLKIEEDEEKRREEEKENALLERFEEESEESGEGSEEFEEEFEEESGKEGELKGEEKVEEEEEEEEEEDDSEVLADWEMALDEEVEEEENRKKIEKIEEVRGDWEKVSREGEEEKSEEEEKKEIPRKKNQFVPRPELRAPIVCILGHVDTGKTKLLDKIRNSRIQEGEAGGITQQIGATLIPADKIVNLAPRLPEALDVQVDVPGLLMIDTPGHETFQNLRSRGSNLCDLAILVVDIRHGLEKTTLESIRMLKEKKIPFVVALNQIDRFDRDWESVRFRPFQEALAAQEHLVQLQFEDCLKRAKLSFAEQGMNAELYCRNEDERNYIHLVPTSAISGEGVPDLLMMLCKISQRFLAKKLQFQRSLLEATVLEMEVIEGFGTTIGVILRNGQLKVNDRIIMCGLGGPVDTKIKTLLLPSPMSEIRDKKNVYSKPRVVNAALGVKIAAPDLGKVIPGSSLFVVRPDDDVEEIKEEVMSDLKSLLSHTTLQDVGVCVQSSSLGSLEALLVFLADQKIPVCGINIGPIHLKDVKKAMVMLEHDPMYSVILGFDVKVHKDAQLLADQEGVTIFTADIIYHLEKMLMDHIDGIKSKRKEIAKEKAVFPCYLRQLSVFNKREPLILGVEVVKGTLRVGTPLVALTRSGQLNLGKVLSIELSQKPVQIAKAGAQVSVKIHGNGNRVGRQLPEKGKLVSLISRESITAIQESFADEITADDIRLFVELKKLFGVV